MIKNLQLHVTPGANRKRKRKHMQDTHTNAQEAYMCRPALSSPSKFISILNMTEKHENKEYII